ncbi:hypothetical protein QMK61_00650 [Fulvimonas sp. R45]|uniref:hypothetical protein n=1 Tax=Fulvimonas sp. R45 TaxID=3045937 RepID=UPI00265E4887|nr:hypothetical protein [Fulvimonas sp. R45]MDO1527330.1 hypothetical protein [Fulvimonas sp. R45]
MNTQPDNVNSPVATMDDTFVSAPIQATSLVSLLAALLITGFGLYALSHGAPRFEPHMIDGIKVTDLAPVEVRADAAELRAATLSAGTAIMALPRSVETGAGMLGAQLAMPYYSFGDTKASFASSKE